MFFALYKEISKIQYLVFFLFDNIKPKNYKYCFKVLLKVWFDTPKNGYFKL